VVHYVRKGDWHSEIVGVEVCILDWALINRIEGNQQGLGIQYGGEIREVSVVGVGRVMGS
jgi:hypothetical protein